MKKFEFEGGFPERVELEEKTGLAFCDHCRHGGCEDGECDGECNVDDELKKLINKLMN